MTMSIHPDHNITCKMNDCLIPTTALDPARIVDHLDIQKSIFIFLTKILHQISCTIQ